MLVYTVFIPRDDTQAATLFIQSYPRTHLPVHVPSTVADCLVKKQFQE